MKNLFANKPRRTLGGSLLLILLGVILWGGFNTAMEATNTLGFCISCHEMESTVYQEYKTSVHAQNPSGVRAACPDCHVPKEWVPKVIRKIQASQEVYHWLVGTIDTPEKFEARRPQLAQHVWETMKATDSRECRNCHDYKSMDFKGQARFAARIHQDAFQAGKTCIDCHKGISHHLPKRKEVVVEARRNEFDEDLALDINDTCAGCHGENGEGTADGEYPRLAGLPARYIATQLRHFKSRERLNIPMAPFANDRELPEEDVLAISAYLSSISLPSKLKPVKAEEKEGSFNALGRLQASRKVVNIARYPGNIDVGRRVFHKECATCHGQKAEGSHDGRVPPLMGQHSLYIKRQIGRFREGKRLHDDPRDAEIFRQFADSEIDDILAFLSTLDD